jgi:hypothetical protein
MTCSPGWTLTCYVIQACLTLLQREFLLGEPIAGIHRAVVQVLSLKIGPALLGHWPDRRVSENPWRTLSASCLWRRTTGIHSQEDDEPVPVSPPLSGAMGVGCTGNTAGGCLVTVVSYPTFFSSQVTPQGGAGTLPLSQASSSLSTTG